MTLSVEMIAESMQPFGARVVMQQERTFAFRRVQMLTPESENTLEEDVLYVSEPKVIRRLPKGLLHDHFFVVRARPEDAEPVRPGVNALLAMPSPIGIMDISAPIVKKPMPIISITAPNKNSTNAPEDNGKSVMLRIKTIAVNGSTEASDSIIFSFKRIFSNRKIPPFRVFQEIPDFPSVLLSILSSRTFPCQSVLRLLNIKHSVTALLFILCSYFI